MIYDRSWLAVGVFLTFVGVTLARLDACLA